MTVDDKKSIGLYVECFDMMVLINFGDNLQVLGPAYKNWQQYLQC